MKRRFGFYFHQSEAKRVLTREKVVSSNYKPRFKRIVFSRSSGVALSGSFDKIRNIFGVLELFVIQTYQEQGYIFEDG